MERMEMHSRDEYLKVLREGYFKAGSKKETSQILDEYCCNTGQSRKYVIRKIHTGCLKSLWLSFGQKNGQLRKIAF